MRILLIGTVEFSLCVLERLISLNINLVGVCTKDTPTFNSDFADLKPLCISNAIPYLCVDDISSNIISNKLGFAEPTAFIRAFKRWYGNTPSRYKKNYISMSSYDAGVI